MPLRSGRRGAGIPPSSATPRTKFLVPSLSHSPPSWSGVGTDWGLGHRDDGPQTSLAHGDAFSLSPVYIHVRPPMSPSSGHPPPRREPFRLRGSVTFTAPQRRCGPWIMVGFCGGSESLLPLKLSSKVMFCGPSFLCLPLSGGPRGAGEVKC